MSDRRKTMRLREEDFIVDKENRVYIDRQALSRLTRVSASMDQTPSRTETSQDLRKWAI